MIDYEKGVYDFEDSTNAAWWSHKPTIVELRIEQAAEEQADIVELQDAEEREALLKMLGSRPTSFPRVIGAGDFAGMLTDLREARTMADKAAVLNVWSEFFHGSMEDALKELAAAILEGDEQRARRLIAKICA